MNNTLIEQLSRLKLEESALKRALDKNLSAKERKKTFDRLKFVLNEQKKIKFKIHLEKEMIINEFGQKF